MATPTKNFIVKAGINPNYPPLRIRHKTKVLATNYTPLLKNKLDQYWPYFHNMAEYEDWILRKQKYEMQQAMLASGNPFAGLRDRRNAMIDSIADDDMQALIEDGNAT